MTPTISNALSKAPSLETVRMVDSFFIERWIRQGLITIIGKSQSLQEIQVLGNRSQKSLGEAMRDENVPQRVIQLFKFIETEQDRLVQFFLLS